MATITFDRATCLYPGEERPAVDGLTLQVADGEFLVLVGPSGCGKSTTLQMVAGLTPVHSGRILIGDRDITRAQPKDRDLAMVFQNYALYPHLSVRDNMGFALKCAGVPKAEIAARVEKTAKMLGLEEVLSRKPKALSGGQRQRVAMGRAIVRNPQAFLMDEPLSNLDAQLRVQMRSQIAALQRQLGITTLYVTHDQVEALTMGERIAVLKDGVLQQVCAPREMYDRPANQFVASFIGSPPMNLLTFQVVGEHALLGNLRLRVPRETISALAANAPNAGGQIVLGIRPEHLVPGSPGDPFSLPIRVELVEELGADTYLHGQVEGIEQVAGALRAKAVGGAAGMSQVVEAVGTSAISGAPGISGAPQAVVMRVAPHVAVLPGSTVYATFAPEHLHFFAPTGTQERLLS